MSPKQSPVTLPNTETYMLQSSHVNQVYKVFVSLPADYAVSEDTYPVLYVTDANYWFSVFHEIARLLPVPPMIVVGIGYPTDVQAEIFRLRARDFLPTQNKSDETTTEQAWKLKIESGGGSSFLSFVREELFPFIDAQYRISPGDRALYCYSFGGTFGLYTLFKYPDTFTRYIIGAPDLRWDNQICFAYEHEYAERFKDLSARLYFCVGALDEDLIEHNASLLLQFHAILKSRNYTNLNMEFRVFDGETHLTGILPSISWGLRSVFS